MATGPVEPILVEVADPTLPPGGAGAFAVATDGTRVVGLLRQIGHAIGVSPDATRLTSFLWGRLVT